jgi:chromate transporter
MHRGWMTDRQFLDGLALSGILPAPLIIFATFVGYLGGGPLGALVMTVAIFAPAFGFTLLGHDFFERLLHRERLRVFLDGVAAAVVGLIAATAVQLLIVALDSAAEAAVFAAALAALFKWHAKLLIPLVIGAAALVGFLLDTF